MATTSPKKKNWGLQLALCSAVVAWQVYELSTATEAQSTTLLALDYTLIAFGVIGGVGALYMMAKGDPTGA